MPQLPIDLDVRLPGPEWAIADPEAVGVTHAALVAVRADSRGVYSPILTVSGDVRPRSDSVDDIADESLAVFAGQVRDADVLRRAPHGGDASPGMTQLLGGRTFVPGGGDLELRQAQLIATVAAQDDPDARAVLLFTVTCTLDQLDVVGPEFQTFVEAARPAGWSEQAEGESTE